MTWFNGILNSLDIWLTPTKYEAMPPEIYYDSNVDEDYDYSGGGGWLGMTWHCSRCGSILEPQNKKETEFYCSNEQCCHSNGMLKLNHPCSTESKAGESYSISWIR